MSHSRNRSEAKLAKYLYDAVEATDTRQIFIFLRDGKANPNFILDQYGISPFHFVIGNESKKFAFEATKLMLLYGADPNVRSEDGLTPVHVATVWNRTAILHQLLKAGGDPFLRDDDNKTAVDYAVEGGLTKALQIINIHVSQASPSSNENCSDSSPHYTLTLEKVYLYRNDVKAEYSAQPTQNKQLQEQRRNKRQEEVFRYPTDWSSSETSGSDVSVTHRITVPPNGNIQIESIVKSDDDRSVRHNAVQDSNIQRTILTYLQDCQVYECVVPSVGDRTPEQRSHSSTPSHKTPSAVNFTSLCNNLAKELHEKLLPPQSTSCAYNVSNENHDLYQTCLTGSEKSRSHDPCHSSGVITPCLSPQRNQKKCVRNIFMNKCNDASPSLCVNSHNIPRNFAQRSVCEHCEDILCNNFKIVCYHLCDSQAVTNRVNPECSCSAQHGKQNGQEFCGINSEKSLTGFEKISKNERSKAHSASNFTADVSAPPLDSVDSSDRCDNSAPKNQTHSPSTPNNKKSKQGSSFLKNRAKLEKAFLRCLRINQVNEPNTKQADPTKISTVGSPSLIKHRIDISSNEIKSSEIPPTQQFQTNNVIANNRSCTTPSKVTTCVRDSFMDERRQLLHIEVSNNDKSENYATTDPSSPKKCNICDYLDESQETEPLMLTACDGHSCSGTQGNRFSLPVSASPIKLDNYVELHSAPTKNDEEEKQQPSPELDNPVKSSSTFETVIKVLSKDSSSSDNNETCDVPKNPGSLESLTYISDMQAANQTNDSHVSSYDGRKSDDVTNSMDVAFCLSAIPENDSAVKEEVGAQSGGRNSCLSEFSDVFFSSSERGSVCCDKLPSPNSEKEEPAPGRASSSDYFSPHELTRSYWTSDEEPSFLGPSGRKEMVEAVSWRKCGGSSENKDVCGFDGILITSDDEPTAKDGSKFNVCEEYKYVDKEKDIVFRETRFKSSTVRLSALSGFGNLSPTENERKTHELSDEDSSKSVSSVSSLTYDTDTLRLELKQKGYVPGPITFTTKRLYLRKLKRINRKKSEVLCDSGVIVQNPESFSHEVDRTINQPDDKEWQNLLQSWSHLEIKMSSYFETPTRHAKWRGGISKCSFTYLLLDPRVTENLPARSQTMATLEVWSTFLKAIFYVGKGKRSRPYAHLYEAVKFWNDGTSSNSEKTQHILNLWKSNHGVICLNVFQNIMPVEALTREAAMIEALGVKNLKNEKHGEYYGPCTSWSQKQKCQLGCFLLYRALIVFLADGERQLKPYDVE
nr:PREDICTED: uncharacterized protein LOC109031634 isoform X1 [Bemisia tabaci]